MHSYGPPPPPPPWPPQPKPDRDMYWWVPFSLVSLPMMLLFGYEFFFYAFVRDACGIGGCTSRAAALLNAVPLLYFGGAVLVVVSALPPWRKSLRLFRYIVAIAGVAISASAILVLLEAHSLVVDL